MKKSYAQILNCCPRCYGWITKCTDGRYIYQNDNDLGLYNEICDFMSFKSTIVRKIKCGKGYILQLKNMPGCVPTDDSAVPLKTCIALLHECHEGIDPLTPHEKKLCDRYWKKVWSN